MGGLRNAETRMVWVDLEMTGLDPEREVIIEIASLVTEPDLTIVAEGPDLVLTAPEERLAGMIPVVQEMHQKSGLTEAVRASEITVAEAERRTLEFVREHVTEKGTAPLCGNSIHTDRRFLAKYMRELDGYLHYRCVDVSTVKELARRWFPREFVRAPKKQKGHRALGDIRESVEELRYWRRAVFRPPPD